MALKKLYSWLKKVYQFKNNLFFQANISTPGRVQYIVKKNLTPSCLHNWSTGIIGRYLALDITTAWGCTPTKHRETSLQ